MENKPYFTRKDIDDKLNNTVQKTDYIWDSRVKKIILPSLDIYNEELTNLNNPCSNKDINNLIKRFNSSTGAISPNITNTEKLGDITITYTGNTLRVGSEGFHVIWNINNFSTNNSNATASADSHLTYNKEYFYKIELHWRTNKIGSGSNRSIRYLCDLSNDGENYDTIEDILYEKVINTVDEHFYHSHFIKPNENINYVRFRLEEVEDTVHLEGTPTISIKRYLVQGLPLFE